MSRTFAAAGRLLRALVAFAVLTGFTLGVPWLLSAVAGWPLDWIGWPNVARIPGPTDLYTTITNPWSDEMVLALLASIGWVLWLQFVRDLVIEVIEASAAASAARHGRPRPPVGRRGPIRWVAAVLVGAIVGAVLLDLARAGTTPSRDGSSRAARPAAALAASAAPTRITATNGRARTAIHVPAASRATAVSTASHTEVDVPEWARSWPGGYITVCEGDNLWNLAKAHDGDPYQWRDWYTTSRGLPQANGYALTDPDELHVGWTLRKPVRATNTPPPAQTQPSPAVTGAPSPAAPAPAATAPAPSSPAQSTPMPSNAAPSSPAGTPAAPSGPATTTAEPQPSSPAREDARPGAGVTLPASGWVSLGLAATIAAVAAAVRVQRRRHARLSFPVAVTTQPQPAPIPESLAVLDAVGRPNLSTDTHTRRPAAPVGINADGAEVSLFDLPGPGIAVHGAGAEPAARAILAAVLATGAVEAAADTRPVVVTTEDLLAQLLPPGAPPVGLDPDGTSFDGDRLIVLADTAAALTHAEEEMIGRRRLMDAFDAETIAGLNARTDHVETQPPYVLLIEATTRHAGRLHAVAAHRHDLDLHPVIVGASDSIPTVEVAADGTITGSAANLTRLATLTASDLSAVLALLTEAVPRPETGHEIDDPTPPAAPTEPAEPIPAQPRDTPALIRLRVLGPVTVVTDAGPLTTGMRSGSYAALALTAAHSAGRTLDQLAHALYPDVDKTLAVKRVRTDINTARRVLREATGHNKVMFIVHEPATGRYRLDPDAVAVDLWQMLTAIEYANTATDDAEALDALREAADLYGGDFADGLDRAWVTDHATTFRHQILAVHARIAEILETDHPDQAAAALERAIDLDPVSEELYQRIMRIHGRAHRPDAVRRTLRRLEERLAELNTEPSQATRRVAERQLRPDTDDGARP
jgi:DNA-binding SARP family transcriptional activator